MARSCRWRACAKVSHATAIAFAMRASSSGELLRHRLRVADAVPCLAPVVAAVPNVRSWPAPELSCDAGLGNDTDIKIVLRGNETVPPGAYIPLTFREIVGNLYG